MEFEIIKYNFWTRDEGFLHINPSNMLPVLQETHGLRIYENYAILEYFKEKYPSFNFITEDILVNCEIRRLVHWFNDKFYKEVSKLIIDERFIKPLASRAAPRTEILKVARKNLNYHMQYISCLLQNNNFIAGDFITAADVALASHISLLDYFAEINWHAYSKLHYWYSVFKSRPSMRPILAEKISGMIPPKHYQMLDF